jgi:peroxiredoxin
MPALELRTLGSRTYSPPWRVADRKGPVLIVYWLPGNRRSAELLQQYRDLIRDLVTAGVEVVTVTALNPSTTEADLLEAARALKLDVPVLLDERLALSTAFAIESVPALVLIDGEGIVRASGAKHFRHEVSEGVQFEAYLRKGLQTGEWETVAEMPHYDPTLELVGRPYMDFTLPDIITLKLRRFGSLLSKDLENVVIFWSVRSLRSARLLSDLSRWYEEEGKNRVNMLSIASATDEAMRASTARFMSVRKVHFPVLMDHDEETKKLYRVSSIPVVMLIGPDGMITGSSSGARAGIPEEMQAGLLD